jgi:starch synthase
MSNNWVKSAPFQGLTFDLGIISLYRIANLFECYYRVKYTRLINSIIYPRCREASYLRTTLKVLFLAAEADPLIKIGGLGDVAGSLPLALRNLSDHLTMPSGVEVDVRLAIPFHGAIQRQAYPIHRVARFEIPYKKGHVSAEALSMDLDGMPLYLIGGRMIPADAPVYSGDNSIDGLKFTFFSMAALELTRQLGWVPDVLHANDWHTAPAIYALSRLHAKDSFFKDTVTVMGVHNLPYLGVGAGDSLAAYGLPPDSGPDLPKWARDVPLALGLQSADHIVTVSPTYAKEILTPQFGAGLDAFLRKRADHISGILNGLDVQRWNPADDEFLVSCFDQHDLQARQENKTALQAEFGLEQDAQIPLLAMITRLDHQKGVDLLPQAMRLLSESFAFKDLSWQAIILGTGDPAIEADVIRLEEDFPNRVRAAMRFDAALSRRIYASADMMLIPSRYEPCGMTQMIAMRYGCVPVGRATGGLRDTIRDHGLSRHSTGFLFVDATPEALALTLGRALRVYADPVEWRGIQQRGMEMDFSWQRSACQYLELYLALLERGKL